MVSFLIMVITAISMTIMTIRVMKIYCDDGDSGNKDDVIDYRDLTIDCIGAIV